MLIIQACRNLGHDLGNLNGNIIFALGLGEKCVDDLRIVLNSSSHSFLFTVNGKVERLRGTRLGAAAMPTIWR